MRTLSLTLAALVFTACIPNYATVDEACDDKLPGAKKITNKAALDVFSRINCYRRVGKLSRARMDPKVQEAVEFHNNYQSINFTEEDWPNNLGIETAGKVGYTGDGVYERLEDVGYANTDRGGLGVWEYIYWDSTDAVDRIDFWFHDPQARQSFMQLAWVAGGYSEAELQQIDPALGAPANMAYMNIFYQTPVRDHAGVPAFYPKDGQEDVPTGFEAVDSDNPMIGRGLLGYPITVSVGSLQTGSHQIKPTSAILNGPGGTIDLEVFTPETDPWMRYTAAFYPLEPLEPNSEYTLELDMEWIDQESRYFEVTFKTGKESVPHGSGPVTGREVPQRPLIRHKTLSLPH